VPYPKLFEKYFNVVNFEPNLRRFIMAELSSEDRAWHGLVHHAIMLNEVAEQFRLIKGEEPRDLPTYHSIVDGLVATFFHDIVYDATRTDNEEESAATMKFWLDPKHYDVPLIEDMILRTKEHRIEGSWAMRNFLLADMSILWTYNPQLYLFYARGIRQEYRHVPNDVWRERRPAVLRQLVSGSINHRRQANQNIELEIKMINEGAFDL
jgi:predicted metal-dependent HD superfamily phosphohydrolase